MTRPALELSSSLRALDGKSYNAYKTIKGIYDFGQWQLLIDHIQGDPFAAPSRLRIKVPQNYGKFAKAWYANRVREIALRDFITRAFHGGAQKFSKIMGSGKSGLIVVDCPGQQILEKTSAFVNDDFVEVRFLLGLPAEGRRILGRRAEQMLCQTLPELVSSTLVADVLDHEMIKKWVETAEDSEFLRARLNELGLVAFVPDGAHLPRESGVLDTPLKAQATPFQSPESLRVSFNRPNLGAISGMGIKKGVTLIVGGGYHGKSTLLRAIEMGIYNHIPLDGREFVVTASSALKIRAEDGRSVGGVTITPFIKNLPHDRETDNFITENGSGSTSQAANIIEGIEAGAKVFLIDEDTSATNFMIRDKRMQELIHKNKEPITPFVDRVRSLYEVYGISTILVMGGSGDYFDVSDQVIAMENYQPWEATAKAKAVAEKYPTGRIPEGDRQFGTLRPRVPLLQTLASHRGLRDVHIRVRQTAELEYGEQRIDVAAVAQFAHSSQLRAIGYALARMAKEYGEDMTIPDWLELLGTILSKEGPESLSREPLGNLATFRTLELAQVLNRMRNLIT
jgi:predicted ABC-class ATPase